MEPEWIHNGTMPVTLSVKNVPAKLAENLRQRAARNHRSLQGELMAILEEVVGEPDGASLARSTPASHRRGTMSVEEASRRAAARWAHLPPRATDEPSSGLIVRQMRDQRWG